MPKLRLKQSFSGLKSIGKSKTDVDSKKKQEQQLQAPAAAANPIPRGLKVITKYPLYEPFSHVVIVQNPKTGEHKYILDELQLDPLERGVYNRILEILTSRN